MMIEFEQALGAILKNTKELANESVPIDDSVGRTLIEDIYSKIEMPPFNKSAMDGYAVKTADIKNIPVKLKCVGFIQAGRPFKKRVRAGECVKIMTGASLPKDTDGVVMVEDTRRSGDHIEIMKAVKKWKNVCFQGEDIKKGQKVLETKKAISISDIALLATIGRRLVKVVKRPKVAILNTGGEIVPVGRKLGGKKIYNSNGPQLSALLKSDGINSRYLGIAKDKPQQLTKALKKGLKADVLLVSGGVSVGDYDLVPGILRKLNVKKIFHNVNIKPGKPLFFGTKENTVVFGIPGNPVSNFLAYNIFIRPALYKMMGRKLCEPKFEEGTTKRPFHHKGGRKHFVPVEISNDKNRYYLSPVTSHGSADILALSKADGFMVIDADRRVVKERSKTKFIRWKRREKSG